MSVNETNEHGHAVSREILCASQDAYTSDLFELYSFLMEATVALIL